MVVVLYGLIGYGVGIFMLTQDRNNSIMFLIIISIVVWPAIVIYFIGKFLYYTVKDITKQIYTKITGNEYVEPESVGDDYDGMW